mmetsp:Transcript_41115/g.62484  ORF Transcript_41115/g.62484 Transcript_41115/m.62484 type:complete len:95 (+) Transcript_41115:881-1165(+)
MENWFKVKILRRPNDLISAVHPTLYSTRFIQFMCSQVLIDAFILKTDDFDIEELFEKMRAKSELSKGGSFVGDSSISKVGSSIQGEKDDDVIED